MHVPWKESVLVAFLASAAFLPTAPSAPPPCIGKRALLLTAHPDDECMFFSPTVLALASELFTMCLSTGNADGLGQVRKGELDASLDVLGVPKNQSIVLDHPDFQDSMSLIWDAKTVARSVQSYAEQHDIDTILTFDDLGVSRHPNHASLVHGARLVPNARVAVLKTIPTLPLKYSGALLPAALKIGPGRLLSSIPTRFLGYLPGVGTLFAAQSQFGDAMDGYYVSTWRQYLQGVQAMQAHESQMVWFRWLYISTSQYMWYNAWQCIN
ncbi:LmbE-like protein [Auricularia subglabra TFB-10046 SS5]|nr:LmbE-like protein [Auricularia subglabra TFB-10046 SS5]